MRMELSHRIDDGKVPVAGQSGQRKHRHPGGQISDEFGQRANSGTPRPRFYRVHHRDERQRAANDEHIGNGQREYVAVEYI